MSRGGLPPEELAGLEDSVLRDLRGLRDADLTTADADVVTDASVRMRRLCIERLLPRYRKAIGLPAEPRITAPVLSSTLLAMQPSYAQAGILMRRGPVAAGTPADLSALANFPSNREMSMTRWLSDECLLMGGQAVRREQVIKYLANKRGGVHWDPRRDPAKDQAYIALDRASRFAVMFGLDAAQFEFAASVLQLLTAPGVLELL